MHPQKFVVSIVTFLSRDLNPTHKKKTPEDGSPQGKEFLFCFSFLIKENLVLQFLEACSCGTVNPESSETQCAPSCSLDTLSECPREDLNSPLLPFWLEVFPLSIKRKLPEGSLLNHQL
jgi:hypothetical protein